MRLWTEIIKPNSRSIGQCAQIKGMVFTPPVYLSVLVEYVADFTPGYLAL